MSFEKKFGHFTGDSAKEKMKSYIKQNFTNLLGPEGIALLDEEDGLARVQAKFCGK
ncbi:MAG: hypothetical protein KC646_15780 [Candidatus Cloacimonetes bacterium]|nr:hypothetical protein [Candidatus Cloacimonadota bacterium]